MERELRVIVLAFNGIVCRVAIEVRSSMSLKKRDETTFFVTDLAYIGLHAGLGIFQQHHSH
jgi:hypothetical protein